MSHGHQPRGIQASPNEPSLMSSEYLHSFSSVEQERLLSQADFLAPWIHSQICLAESERVLEIGCGVGAQLRLLAHQPCARLVGVDFSSQQLQKAQTVLSEALSLGTVELVQADAAELPFSDSSFDQVVLFFVLEHVPSPSQVLSESFRLLQQGGRLTLTEVNNHSLQVWPSCPSLIRLWQAYNQLQRDLGGDPDVGLRLVNLGLSAGFLLESEREIGPVLDARVAGSERLRHLEFWRSLLLSTTDRLIAEGRVAQELVAEAFLELENLVRNREGILHYSGRQTVFRKGLDHGK